MRFAHIKLSGFKSFADSTIIPVSGALTGVVGPNGCGKSNVIDAIRWVMGERSASALRGEDMHDVIFNGSDKRPPADRASVELHFNAVSLPSDSPWSAFHEISIKRQITRNHTSDYYINHQKVRRKDVADLFLGTGLGPRSYAIIEQGMVNRIIEANPKELRVFLEEAAGVSKYKERRHETENRMEDARANLNRVEDIRVEVAAQVERLRIQAEVALKYQALQQAYLADQRLLAVMQWRTALAERQQVYEHYLIEQTTLATHQSKIAEMDRRQSEQEAAWQAAQDALEEAQSDLMAYNAQVAELEQDLRLGTQQRGHLAQNEQKLAARLQQLTEQNQRLEEEILLLQAQHEEAQSERLAAETQHKTQLQAFYAAEKALALVRQTTEQQRDEATRKMSLAAAEAAEIKTMHERLADIRRRRDTVEAALQALPLDTSDDHAKHDDASSPFVAPLAEVMEQAEHGREQMLMLTEELVDAESQAQENHQALALLRQRESGLSGRIQTLERQLAATSQHQDALPTWLAAHHMLPSQPLAEVIKIEGRWEHAVAVVLADWLGVRWLPAWRNLADLAQSTPPVGPLLISDAISQHHTEAPKVGTLAEQIRVEDPGFSAWLVGTLNRYRLCDDWQAAVAQREALADQECWVSPEGVVVSRHHLHFPGDGGARAIHLENRHALEEALAEQQQVAETLQTLLSAQEQSNRKCARLCEQKNTLEGQQQQLQKNLQTLSAEEREWQFTQQSAAEKTAWQRREWEKQRLDLADEEAHWSDKQANSAQVAVTREAEQMALKETLASMQSRLHEQEGQVRDQREAMRQQELLLQRLQHQVEQVVRDIQRVEAQQQNNAALIEDTQDQWEQLREEIAQLPQVEEVDQSLQEMLALKKAQTIKVADLRQASELTFSAQKQASSERQKSERHVEQARERMSQHQLTLQACDLHAQQYREHYVRHGGDLQALTHLESPDDLIAATENHQRSIDELQTDINRREADMKALEPVNLAAIAELEQESARLNELVRQSEDLNTALDTLQSAIVRIDQEMRGRMLEVFERVNVKFGELFRLIFGGGQAEIILTGEEILDAGVVLKAQPLGKNNASIHLLSGGEKALTAISLVFAFFALNPAPFCVLDEVDAPLDDANTRRFTELIRDMSVSTQFLVISHNRITMEAMQTLVGVTMRDPGVSKMVSVDLLNALAHVDTAVATANDTLVAQS